MIKTVGDKVDQCIQYASTENLEAVTWETINFLVLK